MLEVYTIHIIDNFFLYILFIFSAISLSDSLTDVETASLGRSRNYSTNAETSSLSCSKTRIDDCDSVSITSSPSRKFDVEKKSKKLAPRPSSLAYDSANYSASGKSETSSKSKSTYSEKSTKKNQERYSHISNRSKSKSRSRSKSESSDSSTETEEKVRPKCTSSQKTLPTPGSDADGFFSDDEHTPLVSPFHINKSSHYNLQSSKSEKDCTPEKSIPKHSKSDAGAHRKSRKPLERQFSIDSNLCDHSRPPPSSTSMVEISTPHTTMQYVPVLTAYGQDISDASSPEIQVSSILDSQVHNETVL